MQDIEFRRLQARDMLWTGPICNTSVEVVQREISVEFRTAEGLYLKTAKKPIKQQVKLHTKFLKEYTTRKRGTDGKVKTVQTLHNLNEDGGIRFLLKTTALSGVGVGMYT
ncbi:hypothetical protein Tco_0126834 [Tanacetum coccineum]